MESSRAASSSRPLALPRALCLLILGLMAAAAIYGGIVAIRYFRQIGV